MGEFVMPADCSPAQHAEIAGLLDAMAKNPEDARGPLQLGNLLYDLGRGEEAIGWWEKAVKLDRASAAAWRNLGIGYYNVLHDKLAAKGAYQRAFRNSLASGAAGEAAGGTPALPGAARILYERDQLWKRTGALAEERLAELEQYPELVRQRDDLTIEYCALLNQMQRWEEALGILRERRFGSKEGGAGMVLAQWARAHVGLGRGALWRAPGAGGSPKRALALFEAVMNVPENLGEKWPAAQDHSEAHYWAGMVAKACQEGKLAEEHIQAAAATVAGDRRAAAVAYSEASYWAGLALEELGRREEARGLFEAVFAYAEGLKGTPAKVEYRAAPLAEGLVFAEDAAAWRAEQAVLLEALARWGMNGPGDRRMSRRLLGDLLLRNPSHGVAADLLVAMDWT